MPFMAALSAGQITQVRDFPQSFEHYLLVNPNDIVWQVQINDTKTSENYAEIAWNNEQQGTRGDVYAGMVCLITTSTTDFSEPVLRGRVRQPPSTTAFYINENSIDLDNSMYITVIDDFDIVERLARVDVVGAKFKDWDIPWAKMPPTVDGLQSVYADLTGAATVSWSFTPTATAQANGASIATWLWDVGDGTITVGSVSTQNITVSFPNTSEHRWVHLTVTDDNGNATTFHFEVYTVNPSSATAVKLDAGNFSIQATVEEGYNATIEVWEGFDQNTVLDQTRMAIVSIDNYNGISTPIVSNIMMVGRLRTEDSSTVGDEQYAVVRDATLTVEGFLTQLARIVAQPVYIMDTPTPAAWGEIDNPTPTRVIAFFLLWHTTYLTLSSFSSDDFSAFIHQDWSLGENNAVEHINAQAQSVNAGMFTAPSGETTIRRLASYTPAASRGGLTTVFDFTTADAEDFDVAFEYGQTVGEVEVGAVSYNHTLQKITQKYMGRAPAQSFGAGYEISQLNGQILTASAAIATARAEVAQRAADHLSHVNPKPVLTIALEDGYWWLIPNLYQRFSMTLVAGDTIRGRTFSTSDYWQLTNLSYSLDNEHGQRPVSATFHLETQGENAGVLVAAVPDVNGLDFSLPPLGAYDFFADDPLINYPDDDPPESLYLEGSGFTTEPYPEGNNNEAPPGAETLKVPMFNGSSVATTNNTVNGETYLIRVAGEGKIRDTWSKTFDFHSGKLGWVAASIGGFDRANHSPNGWEKGRDVAGNYYYIQINSFIFTAAYVTTAQLQFDVNLVGQGRYQLRIPTFESPISSQNHDAPGTKTHTFTVNDTLTQIALGSDTTAATNISALTSITISGTGEPPPEFGEGTTGQRGDSFYKNYDVNMPAAYAAAKGLLIDSGKPGTVPSYSSGHAYEFEMTGTGGAFTFEFIDPDGDYSDNDHNWISVTIEGPGMGPTA